MLTMCVPVEPEKSVYTGCAWYDDTEGLPMLTRQPEQGTGYLGMSFVWRGCGNEVREYNGTVGYVTECYVLHQLQVTSLLRYL